MAEKTPFFDKTYVKFTVLALLPMAFSFVSSWFFSVEGWMRVIVGGITLVAVAVNIIALRHYGKQGNERERQRERELNKKIAEQEEQIFGLKSQILALGSACRGASELVSSCANDLYQMIKRERDHSEIQDWGAVKGTCDQICIILYELVQQLAFRGDHFAVNIVFKKTQDNVTGFTMLSRKAYMAHAPGLYNSFIPEEQVQKHRYKHLFDMKPSRPDFLFTPEEIEAVFRDTGNFKYSQYMGIPISCSGNRMIALLQIVSYDDSLLAGSREEFEKLYDDYFCVFSSLALLADKTENVKQLITHTR